MKIAEDTFQKGSIYLAEFPFTDFKSTKIRPVVVLFEEKSFDDVTVMAISSITERKNKTDTILISPEDKDFIKTGLKKASLILTHRMATIKKSRLFYKLGCLAQEYLDEIDMALLSQLKIGYQVNVKQKQIPYGRQSIDSNDVFSVVKTLRSDWLTQGPHIEPFEHAVAEYCKVKYAVAVSSGTAALHIACLAAGLGKGDTLWTSPNTFVASANCALYCGANPDFVDIDSCTYNISINAMESKLSESEKKGRLPKIVIPVHFAGQSCEMEKIHWLSKKYGFTVIEDACHAIGGSYKGSKIGSCMFSDMAIFSFHPVKIITTGEGGMILTNNNDLYQKLILLRTHGITRNSAFMEDKSEGDWYYQQIELGMNYRITDIQAALGLSQLRRIDNFVSRRHELVQRYNETLSDLPLTLPWQHPDTYSAFHLYVVRLKHREINKTRKEVFDFLRQKGIGVNVHYIPVHTQPYYRRLGFSSGQFPEAERYYEESVTLPLFPSMTEEEQDYVVSVLRGILS